MAGLWDTGRAEDGKIIESFTVITTEANAAMRQIHERMPVILKKEDEGIWLDPKATAENLIQLLKPCADEALETYEVSGLVNSPANDTQACTAALKK